MHTPPGPLSALYFCLYPRGGDSIASVRPYLQVGAPMLCYAMLCCAMLCYARLCYAIQCYAALRYAM
eukprot:9490001-Pyramimonas_sp.AAC.1